jgi:hypothetical protein
MSDVQTARTVIKQEDFATLYSDGTILVKEVRLSYPHLDKPFKGEDGQGKPRYGVVALMPKTSDRSASKNVIRDEVRRILTEKKAQVPDTNKFLRDGDLRPDKAYWNGNWTISAGEGEGRPPALRGRGKDPKTGRAKVLTPEEAARVFYAGCVANILIRPWWQDNKYGKKVNANLLAVQFVRDDEAFGEGRISDDAIDESFGAIDDDDSGYDDSALADTNEL